MILAITRDGKDVTIDQIKEWLAKSKRAELADFFGTDFMGVILSHLIIRTKTTKKGTRTDLL